MFFGKDNRSRTSLASLLLAVNLLLAACASGSSLETPLPDDPTTTRTGQLTPYISPTAPFATGETPRSNLPAPTPPPTPTPTPRTHEVKKGEDMGGIAWLYRVSLEALMEANPTVQPNMMSVGTRLIIPPSKTEATGGDAPIDPGAASQTPTPVPLSAGRLTCTRVEDGGVWCFMPVQNTQSFALEGLSAVFRLADEQAQTVLMQRAFLPLDTLPAGVSLPLAAYFPPEQAAGLAFPYQFSSEIISALPSANDGRYLPIQVEAGQVLVSENGLSADISANVILNGTGEANRVWVAAVAYDAQGNVAGVRRWENQDARPLAGGQALEISMSVYSVSNRIERVELAAEARP